MITRIPFHRPADAPLLPDLRFRALRQTSASGAQVSGGGASSKIRSLLALAASTTADKHALLAGTVSVINDHLVKSLGLAEPMEPAKPSTVQELAEKGIASQCSDSIDCE